MRKKSEIAVIFLEFMIYVSKIPLIFQFPWPMAGYASSETKLGSEKAGRQSSLSSVVPESAAAEPDADEAGLEDSEQIFENMKFESERRGFFATELVHCVSKDSKLTLSARAYAGPRGSKLLALKGTGRKMRELYEFNGTIKAVATTSSEKLLLKPPPKFDPDSHEVEIPNLTKINSFRFKLSDSVFLSTGDYREIKVARVAINEIVYSASRRKGNVRIVFDPVESGPPSWRFFVGCRFDSRLYHLKRSLGSDPLQEFKEKQEAVDNKRPSENP